MLIPIKSIRIFNAFAAPPNTLPPAVPGDALMVLLEPTGNVSSLCIAGDELEFALQRLVASDKRVLELIKVLQEQTEHELVVALDTDKGDAWQIGIRPKVPADAKSLMPPVYLARSKPSKPQPDPESGGQTPDAMQNTAKS